MPAIHGNKPKRSVQRDRHLAGKYGNPLFVRGEFVIHAKDFLGYVGISMESFAHEVVEIERSTLFAPRSQSTWKVGTHKTGLTYLPEQEFCLLEEVDDHVAFEENGTCGWRKAPCHA
jgi:hypothetical protein